MNGRGRVSISVVVGLCVAVGIGVFLRASQGSGSSRRNARAAHGKAVVAKPAAPTVISPEQARAEAIRRSIEELRAECQAAAGGDWDRWSARLEPVRAELWEKIRVLKPLHPDATSTFEARAELLEGKDSFPLFEAAPGHYLKHVIRPEMLDKPFGRGQSVIAGAKWLRQKGIDVVFVTVPKMTEVYPEPFLDHVPPDRILSPHLRRIFLELLEADVEVMDLLRDFHRERDSDAEWLYQPADPHWSPRAQAIAARLVANRLSRYRFVARARARPPTCKWEPGPYKPASEGVAFAALNPDQQRRAIAAQPRTILTPKECSGPLYEDSARVVCIGDSYNAGYTDQLARELNLPVRNLSGGGYTTEAFKEFLRVPEILKNARVVVWLVCYSDLDTPWPMPRPILEAVGNGDKG